MDQPQKSFDHTAFVSQVIQSMGRMSFPVCSTVTMFKALALPQRQISGRGPFKH